MDIQTITNGFHHNGHHTNGNHTNGHHLNGALTNGDALSWINGKNGVDVNIHPIVVLNDLAKYWNLDIDSHEFALKLDESNLWPSYRDKFEYPKLRKLPRVDLNLIENPDEDCIYLCGNSLGLLTKASREKVNKQFDKWSEMGAYGHTDGELPWAWCEDYCRPIMANLVGALEEEVNVMNFLSVNLHLMMISFYQPTKERYKILIEDKAFPSDHYAVESQIKLHNLDPEQCMTYVKPREGEHYIRTEDIIQKLEEEGQEIALVILSGIQYYTGQFFQIKEITHTAHKQGCLIGWDLAHAVGNVELKLHDWNVDFAVWCTYKYLNSGAGSIGSVFLHEKHFEIENYKKLDGWWSHRLDTRFKMSNKMEYANGAAAYALSNASMLLCSALMGSLELFDQVGIKQVRKKSRILTGFMELLLIDTFKKCPTLSKKFKFEILTPEDPEQRGAQLSLKFFTNVKQVHEELEKLGIVCDYRDPNVIRFAPAPLYNTFNDVYRFVHNLANLARKFQS